MVQMHQLNVIVANDAFTVDIKALFVHLKLPALTPGLHGAGLAQDVCDGRAEG